jgi:hypothetical protein
LKKKKKKKNVIWTGADLSEYPLLPKEDSCIRQYANPVDPSMIYGEVYPE